MAKTSGRRVWRLRKKIVKRGDTIPSDGTPNDVVIIVMGPTGTGKSTFVNTYFGENVTTVGHRLKSCTSHVNHITRPHPTNLNKRLVLVDTPGFNDTTIDDAEILRRISVWLAIAYAQGMTLAGVIYFHSIKRTRMHRSLRKQLAVFRNICGDEVLSSVIIGTTMWSEGDREIQEERLKNLMEYADWKDMMEFGARLFKFEHTRESAEDMVNSLLNDLDKDLVLQIQKELVDDDKSLTDTKACEALHRYILEELGPASEANPAPTEGHLPQIRTAVQTVKFTITGCVKKLFRVPDMEWLT